jgi:tetratricopeptide (TPR) repeat protein
MRAGVIFCGLAALLFSAPATAQETYAQTRAVALYGELINNSTCETALPTARTFWPSLEFQQQLVLDDQGNFLGAVVQCASFLQDGQAAIAAANKAHDLGAVWADKVRLVLGLSFDNDALAAQSFLDLSQSSPKDFAALESYNAWGAIRAAERIEGGEATALRMYDALVAANYQPPEGYPDDPFRLDHARLLMMSGRVAEARTRLEGVIDPQAIMTIRVSRLYDPLRSDPAFERRLDIAAAGEAAIARARADVAREPRRLAHVIQLSALLRDMGHSDEALALVEATLPRAQASDAAQNFDDVTDQLNWLLNAKADLLYDLGRNEEARTVYSEAMTAGELGSGNVTIDFAGMLNAEGRGADAQQVLQTLGRVTEYGDMWMQSETACAAEQTHDAGARDAALTVLRAHETANPGALMHALLCANNMDEAAALMIRRLGNPKQRETALVALQPYHQLATRHMAMEALELQRLAQVRDRPDVRAAVGAVGRIEPTPIYSY